MGRAQVLAALTSYGKNYFGVMNRVAFAVSYAGSGAHRMVKKDVQRGRSERRGESYSSPYVEPLSEARTKLADFFSILLIVVAWFAGCSDDHRSLTVGSKNFLEQVLLGEIAAQHLEHRLGKSVERKLNLGGTLLAHQALIKGEIDLYPEYTGTAISSVLNLPSPSDPGELLTRVRREYQDRFNLRWMDPLGFDNTFAMVIRRADAEEYHLESLSDAAHYSPGWTIGVGYEFQQRPDGLPKLLSTYRLPLIGSPTVMDLGLLYRALQQKQVSMIAANSTDGLLSELEVTVLRDDRKSFPPYQAAFVVRGDSLKREPSLEPALSELSGKFTEETMRRLNHLVIVQHGSVQAVARQFLKDSGLLAPHPNPLPKG